jgi:hypothetical protein
MGTGRCVEVHAVGYTKTGEPMMRAWQVRGGSARGEKVGWKLMRLSESAGRSPLGRGLAAPRKGYKRGDPAHGAHRLRTVSLAGRASRQDGV